MLILTTLLLWAASATAQDAPQYTVRHDSLHVYLSWEAMWGGNADTIVINPEFIPYTIYDIEFDCIKRDLNKMVRKQAVGVAIGDTLWYVNSRWLKDNFTGDCKRMRDYVPLYFSSKIAFIQWAGTSLPGYFYSSVPDIEEYMDDPEIYVISFENKEVRLLDSDLLTNLLDDYPDLRRRYVSMRDYKERHMIAYFFLQYVERVNADPTVLPLF